MHRTVETCIEEIALLQRKLDIIGNLRVYLESQPVHDETTATAMNQIDSLLATEFVDKLDAEITALKTLEIVYERSPAKDSEEVQP